MNVLRKKIKELIYSFNSEDRYAEYEPDFRMGVRAHDNGDNTHDGRIGNNTSMVGDEEMRGGDGSVAYEDIDFDEYGSNEGVSEVFLAWRHIDSWTTKYNPDLNATLGDPCTANDLVHAEEDLMISFPPSIKASLRLHDGQEDMESMAGTSGLIYGLQLMTLDQIVAMTQTWRNVSRKVNRQRDYQLKEAMASSSSLEHGNLTTGTSMGTSTSRFKLPHIPQQNSIPADAVQPVYSHEQWIPLVTDHAGNHIGTDLAPGPRGKYGQIIIFGRDFDTKYVIAENWGEFLLSFANDLEAGNWLLEDDEDDYLGGDGELAFRNKATNGPIQDYFDVLKQRTIMNYQQHLNDTINSQATEIDHRPQSPLNEHDQRGVSDEAIASDLDEGNLLVDDKVIGKSPVPQAKVETESLSYMHDDSAELRGEADAQNPTIGNKNDTSLIEKSSDVITPTNDDQIVPNNEKNVDKVDQTEPQTTPEHSKELREDESCKEKDAGLDSGHSIENGEFDRKDETIKVENDISAEEGDIKVSDNATGLEETKTVTEESQSTNKSPKKNKKNKKKNKKNKSDSRNVQEAVSNLEVEFETVAL